MIYSLIYVISALAYFFHYIYRQQSTAPLELKGFFIQTGISYFLLLTMIVSESLYLINNPSLYLHSIVIFGCIMLMIYREYDIFKDSYAEASTKRGYMVGRFQPFHSGHKYIVEEALKHVDLLYVCIGSYTTKDDGRNPISGKDRYLLTSIALEEYINDGRVVIVPVPDLKGETNNNTDWGDYLMSVIGKYTKCMPTYTFGGEEICRGNWYSKDILKKLKVVELPKTDISATLIRQKIKDGEDVSEYLPYNQTVKDYVVKLLTK